MKKLINFPTYVVVLTIITMFSLTSCKWVGGNSKGKASSMDNYVGRLVTKVPLDFDDKFGYEVIVLELKEDSTFKTCKVLVPRKTWGKLPEPNDSTVVMIEYISDIEYGENGAVSLYDFQSNICTGYTIVNTKKITAEDKHGH